MSKPPHMIKIGGELNRFASDASGMQAFICAMIFPRFTKRLVALIEALQEGIEKGEFGTDEEIGL